MTVLIVVKVTEVRLTDQSDSTEDLRKREPFWQQELDTSQPNGLNEREVALTIAIHISNLFVH